MRRRTLLVALSGLTVVVAAGAVVLWPRPSSRITKENFDRIQTGMSREEVVAILGPPGDYTTGPFQTDHGVVFNYYELPSRADILSWADDGAYVDVVFDHDDNYVYDRHFDTIARVPLSPLDNLLWRLKRQWHRWFP
jgi:hypothetical protein